MWVAFAFASALFAGLTAILAKIGVRRTDSNLATAIRTVVVLVASWAMVLVVGSQTQLAGLSTRTIAFLVLSGLATGASWLCYFKALQLGDVNRVVPIDRLSIVLTVLFAMLFLGETDRLPTRLLGVSVIGLGTWLMVVPKGGRRDTTPAPGGGRAWLPYAIGAAVFAALTAILGKVGITGVESNLGTAIRTTVVLVMAWGIVAWARTRAPLSPVPGRDLLFIVLSGLATGASWLCFFRALQDGPASVVAPIDKLSIVVTVAFSSLVLGEQVTGRTLAGLVLIVAGTLFMLA